MLSLWLVLCFAAVELFAALRLRVMLTKRAARLSSHAGEVSFPGGKWDDTDETLVGCAAEAVKAEVPRPCFYLLKPHQSR